ncbi:calcium-binding protein, partial [Klebsiella michiganensis]|uniref:calcium-binding protein n=1 Tax=Klebsiella michiganensis TaxID=1134687 RepID=UPI0019544CD8
VYTLGDGADTIDDQGGATGDRLVLHGIVPADVRVVRIGNDAHLLVGPNAGDKIQIKDAFGNAGRIETIVFDDGTTWGEQEILAHVVPNDGS